MEQQLRSELVRVVHHDVREHFKRVTGSDVNCHIAPDLSSVRGDFYDDNGHHTFVIAVVTIFEPHQVSIPQEAERR